MAAVRMGRKIEATISGSRVVSFAVDRDSGDTQTLSHQYGAYAFRKGYIHRAVDLMVGEIE